MAPLTIHRHELRTIIDAAESAYPLECCGLLVGTIDRFQQTVTHVVPAGNITAADRRVVTRVVPAANVAPDDHRRRYQMDPAAVFEAFRRARHAGQHVLGFYHSHPDGPPAPSSHDRQTAWPEKSYLIVALRAGRCDSLKSWRVDTEGTDLIEEPIDTPE